MRFLDLAKFTALIPFSLLILCKLSFPIVGLKLSILLTLAMKSNEMFIWHLGNLLNIHSNSLLKLSFKSPILSFVGA
jgi:hypothetical protein